MQRYSLITDKMPREFLLLQGTGCRWGKCTFCDYHTDKSNTPFEINKQVLEQVTGKYGVIDIINSGSAMELDSRTIDMIKEVVATKGIGTIWFDTGKCAEFRAGSPLPCRSVDRRLSSCHQSGLEKCIAERDHHGKAQPGDLSGQ
jgi:hypothetical protein